MSTTYWDTEQGRMVELPDESGSDIPTGSPENGSSPITLNYYREKVIAFQNALNDLDVTFQHLQEMGVIAYASGDEEMIAQYESLQSEFDTKRSLFAAAAEGIQLASQGINASGVSSPSVEMPIALRGLGVAPVVVIAGVIGTALVLMEWAKGFWRTIAEISARWQNQEAIKMLPEGERASALESLRRTELQAKEAEAKANGGSLGSLASLTKWAVIGGLAIAVWKIMSDHRR